MKRRSFIAVAATLPFMAHAADAPLKIGSPAGPFGDILGFAIEHAHAQGLEVKKIEFTDWITPNEALADGDIDANLFQHTKSMITLSGTFKACESCDKTKR